MNTQPFSTPLLSWDVFLEGYRRRIALAKDFQALTEYAQAMDWKVEWDLQDRMIQQQSVVLVTDPSQQITFASSNLHTMNGYLPQEAIGKTPRIFQGKNTNPSTKAIVRDALTKWSPFSVSLVNYRKNGLPYKCRVDGYPVYNKSGKLVNFIAFEKLEHETYLTSPI